MSIAIYPGSFDPITKGHLDIIERGSELFDHLIVSVLINSNKKPFFSIEERIEMIIESTKHIPNVSVESFRGLLVDYMNDKNSKIIIRGLRAVSDFENEFQMALMNRRLNNEIETVFLMTNTNYSYISSSLIKEVAKFNGDISELVPDIVYNKLKEKI